MRTLGEFFKEVAPIAAAAVIGAAGCQETSQLPANSPSRPQSHRVEYLQSIENPVHRACIGAHVKIEEAIQNPHDVEMAALCRKMGEYQNRMYRWSQDATINDDINLQRRQMGIPIVETDRAAQSKKLAVAKVYQTAIKKFEAAIAAGSPLSKAELEAIQAEIDRAERNFNNGN